LRRVGVQTRTLGRRFDSAAAGFTPHEIALLRLRALLAQTHCDPTAYRNYRDRYRERARSLGFEGHIAMAEAMA
jgi:adenylate cyclase